MPRHSGRAIQPQLAKGFRVREHSISLSGLLIGDCTGVAEGLGMIDKNDTRISVSQILNFLEKHGPPGLAVLVVAIYWGALYHFADRVFPLVGGWGPLLVIIPLGFLLVVFFSFDWRSKTNKEDSAPDKHTDQALQPITPPLSLHKTWISGLECGCTSRSCRRSGFWEWRLMISFN
jgi:hypothetical protein